jgi:hypothetical protein
MGSLMNYENESSIHRRVRRSDTNVLHLNAVINVILKHEWKNKDTEMELKEHENPSTRSTPLKHDHPLSWYVKWVSSLVLIVAMIMTTNNLYPYNMYLQFIGVAGWLWVAILWNDRSLIVLNAVACAIFLNGIFQYFIKA